MTFFLYLYWYDKRFKNKPAGPMKVWELSDNLTKLGHRVILFAPKIGLPKQQTSATVIEIPAIGAPILGVFLYEILLFFSTIYILLRVKCDIVYVRIMTSLVPLIVSMLSKSPMILEVNDDPFFRYEKTAGIKKLKLPIVKLVDKINFKYSSKIIPATEKIKNSLVQKGRIFLPKFYVIRSGANTELFKPYNKIEVRRWLNLDVNKRYIGFAAVYNIKNDYDSLIQSAAIVVKKFPDVRYLIVGNGKWKTNEYPKIIDLGLKNFFIPCGHVLYTEVPKYISAMDICLAPVMKSWGDASSVKVFDYLSCGRPLVINKIGSTGDYLVKGDCVSFVPPEDPQALAEAIIELLQNPRRMEEMGLNGRKFIVENYDRKSVSRKIVEIAKEARF